MILHIIEVGELSVLIFFFLEYAGELRIIVLRRKEFYNRARACLRTSLTLIGTNPAPKKRRDYMPQKANPLSYYSRLRRPKRRAPA